METSEPVAKSDWHDNQKDQARERRRIYARERRRSMSVEEKQRYLAQRRINYQLQRQREESGFGSYCGRKKRRVKFEIDNLTGNANLGLCPKSESIAQSNGASLLGDAKQLENQHASCSEFKSTDAISNQHRENSGRLRLNQIRHLARSVNNSASKLLVGCHQSKADVLTHECFGTTGKSMRLVHLKRLARSLKPQAQRADADAANLPSEVGKNDIAEAGFYMMHSDRQ